MSNKRTLASVSGLQREDEQCTKRARSIDEHDGDPKDHEENQPINRQAVAIQSRRSSLSTFQQLAQMHYEKDELHEALSYYNRALAIEMVILGPDNPLLIPKLTSIAHIHRQVGDYGAALRNYGEAHQLKIIKYGAGSLEVARSFSNMALMCCHMRGYRTAHDMYQEALQIQRDHYLAKSDINNEEHTDMACNNTEHTDMACTLNSIGLVLYAQKDYSTAKTCFQDSLRIHQKSLGHYSSEVVLLLYNLATMHAETGDDDKAICMFKESLRIEKELHGCSNRNVILTLENLGVLHERTGELDVSIYYFSEALKVESAAFPDHTTRWMAQGKLLNLLGNLYLQLGQADKAMKSYTEASRLYLQCGEGSAESLVIAGYRLYGLSKLNPPAAAVA